MPAETRPYNQTHPPLHAWTTMPKKTLRATAQFGARLVQLRKAAGYTQTELASELGVTRRMIAYYEGETEHPPASLLPGLAQALGVTIEQLLSTEPVKKPARPAKPANSRLQRRLAQIEQLGPTEKRQVLQLIDAFIERGQLRKKIDKQPA